MLSIHTMCRVYALKIELSLVVSLVCNLWSHMQYVSSFVVQVVLTNHFRAG